MVPIRLGSVAILTMMREAGLNDTLTALILVYVAQGLPMAIFILSEFIQQIPRDLRDAARCDGVPETRIFFEVIAPLLRPAIATVAVFTIVPIWNDLWFPLMLTSSDTTHTITLGVQQFLGQYITDWNCVLAALSLAILPVVVIYVIFSRQLISRPDRRRGQIRRAFSMATLRIDKLNKCYGATRVLSAISNSRSATASSSCWSAPPAAASRRCCA